MARRPREDIGEDLIEGSSRDTVLRAVLGVLLLVVCAVAFLVFDDAVRTDRYALQAAEPGRLVVQALERQRGHPGILALDVCLIGRKRDHGLAFLDVVVRPDDPRFRMQRFDGFERPQWGPKTLPLEVSEPVRQCTELLFGVPEEIDPAGDPIELRLEVQFLAAGFKGGKVWEEELRTEGTVRVRDDVIDELVRHSFALESLF